MNKTMNIYTDKGFLNLDNLKHTQVYTYQNNQINTEDPKTLKTFCFSILLSTGSKYFVSKDSTLKGLTFSKDIIDNRLDICNISSFNIDDYIYTPFLNIPKDTKDLESIRLDTSTNDKILYYINTDLEPLVEELNLPLKTIISDVLFGDETPYISKIANTVRVDKTFIDFLITSILRGKLNNKITEVEDINWNCESIAYRFKKDNKLHQEMYSNLNSFLIKNNIPNSLVEYDHYFYVNVYNKYLVRYLQKFYKEDFKDVLNTSFEIKEYFLKQLFKYSKNSFYTNPSTFFSLKNLCYNTNQVLSFTLRTNNSKETNPICASIIDKDNSENEISPEIVFLEEGYLTRIVDIKEELEPINTIKNYLLVG